jgi:dTDP-4-amino-4,6-dideoxygalactose transaminase
MRIPFNKPYLSGNELQYINEAVLNGKLSGDGVFTKKCHDYFKSKFGFKQCLLTTSCTDALEMSAILLDIKEGDEVIMPSYTFVSTANAFVLRGAKIIFVDSRSDHPGMNESQIEKRITPKTKAIVVVHYAGVAVDMNVVMDVATKHGLYVVEDAAQAIDSYYHGKPLGSIGHMAAFSFHETKNIQCGEGGMLVVNDDKFIKRAEIIREKGTNRSAFFRGEVDKYGWVDIGSSFLPSEITAAYLYGQLENLESIQKRRKNIWELYNDIFKSQSADLNLSTPQIPDFASVNGHMYYLLCNDHQERAFLIDELKKAGIYAVFHYLSLHVSTYYHQLHDGRNLKCSDAYTDQLLRLPLYFELTDLQVIEICDTVIKAIKQYRTNS